MINGIFKFVKKLLLKGAHLAQWVALVRVEEKPRV